MKTIYMLQHRVEGRIVTHAFAEQPTQAQKDAVMAEFNRRHAAVLESIAQHLDPEEEKIWPKVIEVELLDAAEVPTFPDVQLTRRGGTSGSGETALDKISITGNGTVTGGAQ